MGGHGDTQDCPLDAVMRFSHAGREAQLCDGVDEYIRTVRLMVRRGAKCIKMASSGGVLSLNNSPEDRQFSDSELKAIVDGVSRSIEHWCYLDEEVADMMKAKGVILVATRYIQEDLLAGFRELPPKAIEEIEKLVPLSSSTYGLAIRPGVKIALGTDTTVAIRSIRSPTGRTQWNCDTRLKAGMTLLEAIDACTATPPAVLGKHAPLAGRLREGYDADVIAVASNPLEGIDVLLSPRL
ncbi:hypothetical protein DL764_005413 [Monosporascus ibericus]|uniref:Amidohydrolase-related domain-containing protein n=1 Tax=Monosporascus ibericus TaxID=155417 RepID=A0A4Q4TBZ8_9PEZI|nr:hypothetical protein DL764_005413 [Monosporascus ibericus]